MSEFSRLLSLRKQARAAARQRRDLAGLSRTVQVLRSTVSVGDDDIDLDDVLSGAVGTGETTLELESDVGYLDDGMDADTILGSGAAADAGDLAEVTDAIPDMGDVFDQAADADDEAHEGRMRAIEGAVDIDAALAAAGQAAQDAANALTTSSGKNSRRRGATEPEPPEGGWVQGDQWVRDEDRDGVLVPVQVLVWNGTEFVPEQIIADDILVIGEDGTVRIKDDTVTAGAIVADALDGMTITGAFIRTAPSGQRWEITATGIVGFDEAGLRGATLTPTIGGRLTLGDGSATRRANMSATSMWFIDEGSARQHQSAYSTDGFWVQEMVGGLASGKATQGSAGSVSVKSPDSANPGTSFTTRIYATEDYASLDVYRTAPGVGTSYGSLSMRANGESELRVTRIADTTMGETVFEDGARFADVDIPGNGQIYRFTDGLRVTDPIGIMLMGKTQTPGNEFALKSQLNEWAPIDGTHAWVTSEGREYVRAGGAWKPLYDIARDTNGLVDLPGSRGDGITADTQAQYEVRTGWVILRFYVFGNINQSAGQDVWAGVPAFLRPTTNRFTAAWLSGGYTGTAFVRSNGTVAVANQTGAVRTSSQFTIVYPLP